MRFLVKITVPVEKGNAAIKDGSLPKIVKAIMEEQRPEAAYFTEIDGQRTALVFVNIEETSKIPSIGEPWWLAFGGSVEFHPAMIAEDLMKAGPDLEAAAKKYG